MLFLKGTTINITRGDTGTFNLIIKDPSTESIYIPVTGDVITFTLRNDRKNCLDSIPLIKKTFEKNQITLNPSDTQFLKYNTYLYDIQITFLDGAVNTITNGTLILMSEVG